MKKRKIKLFASVASLALVAAVMGVGVWAASQQAVNLNSTVKFLATGVDATVTLQVKDKAVTGADSNIIQSASSEAVADTSVTAVDDYKTNPVTIETFDAEDPLGSGVTRTIDLVFEDSNENGIIDNGSQFQYEFVITNTSTVKDLYVKVGTISPTTQVKVATDGINYGSATAGSDNYYCIAKGGTTSATITITFEIKDGTAEGPSSATGYSSIHGATAADSIAAPAVAIELTTTSHAANPTG